MEKDSYFEMMKALAEQGDSSAQNDLGDAYVQGEGVEEDFDESVKWFRRAADQGHPLAQINLGIRYREGQGVRRNLREAFIWMSKAVEQGIESSMAQSILGQVYFFGEGIEQDFSKAVECLIRAATVVISEKEEFIDIESFHLDADAQFYLGWCYLTGSGVTRNIENSERMFKAAAATNHEWALRIFRKMDAENLSLEGIGIDITRTHLPWGPSSEVMRIFRSDGQEKSKASLVHFDGRFQTIEEADQFGQEVPEEASSSQEMAQDDQMEDLFLDGLKEKDAGNFDKAIIIWKKILEKDFRHLNAIDAVACAYAETGKLDMAKKYIDMAMKVGGDHADFVRSNLAGILYDSGKFEEAEEILDAIECEDGRMIDNLTRVLVARGKAERAHELIEGFLAKEGALTPTDNDEVRSLQEIVTRGADCILECNPTKAIDFLETYAYILPPEPLSSVYFNAGIHFLQEENDGVRALKCLSEAVKNNPDDSEMREALSDAALKVIAEFGGQEKIFENDMAVLATAYETVGNRHNALEIKKQITPSVKDGDEEKPPLGHVTTAMRPSRKTATEDEVDEKISEESGGLDSFWNEVALKVGERTGLHLITSIEKNKAINQIIFRRGSVKGMYFVFSLRANDWVVRIDIDFGAGKDQESREFFDKIEREASGIEKAFGQPLKWEKGKGRTCKITCPSGVGGYKTPETWSSVQVAMVDMMACLERAVGTVIDKSVERRK